MKTTVKKFNEKTNVFCKKKNYLIHVFRFVSPSDKMHSTCVKHDGRILKSVLSFAHTRTAI